MNILITAGPTREHLDDVRFLSNASSGRMGYALAAEAAARGHGVLLVSGPVELEVPAKVACERVLSAEQMLNACEAHFAACDAAIMCAAVCDYRPAKRSQGKGPKHTAPHQLELEPTPDICAALGANKGHRVVIGFALESADGRARAEAKLRQKHCDAIVLNAPDSIGGETAAIEIFTPAEGWSGPHTGNKPAAARRIIDLVERLAARP